MENIEFREEQIEALEELIEYCPKLTKGLNTVYSEFSNILKEDSWEFLRLAADGFNWVLSILNACFDVYSEVGVEFDKEKLNEEIAAFNIAYCSKNTTSIANCVKNTIIPLVDKIEDASRKVLAAK